MVIYISIVIFLLEKLPKFSTAVFQHDALKTRLDDEGCGNNARKHLLQNASLLEHLEQAGLVQDDTCFIEFGAGKGISSSFKFFLEFF